MENHHPRACPWEARDDGSIEAVKYRSFGATSAERRNCDASGERNWISTLVCHDTAKCTWVLRACAGQHMSDHTRRTTRHPQCWRVRRRSTNARSHGSEATVCMSRRIPSLSLRSCGMPMASEQIQDSSQRFLRDPGVGEEMGEQMPWICAGRTLQSRGELGGMGRLNPSFQTGGSGSPASRRTPPWCMPKRIRSL